MARSWHLPAIVEATREFLRVMVAGDLVYRPPPRTVKPGLPVSELLVTTVPLEGELYRRPGEGRPVPYPSALRVAGRPGGCPGVVGDVVAGQLEQAVVEDSRALDAGRPCRAAPGALTLELGRGMQMFRICAVLAIGFMEPREADGWIAKPRSTAEFWEGDFTDVPACCRMATNQSRPGDVLGVVIPAGGMQDGKARS
jgi:hypothetical protein